MNLSAEIRKPRQAKLAEAPVRIADCGGRIADLRSALLARRRRFACRASRLPPGLRLLAALVLFAAANPLRGLLEAIADALGLLRGVLLLGFGFLRGLRVVLASNELHLRDLGGVATAEPDAQDPRVASWPLGKPRRHLVEQLRHDSLVDDLRRDETPRV